MSLPKHIASPNPEVYLGGNYVCLDFEIDTSHGDYGHPVHPDNQMLLACWSLGPDHPGFEEQDKVYTLWGNEYQMTVLLQHLNASDFVIAHNAKYELGWLIRCGWDIGSKPIFCTKIAEFVLSGNQRISTSLDDCVRRRGGRCKDPVVDKMMKDGINPKYIPPKWLSGRCIQDVTTTETLFKDQRRHLHLTNRLGVVYLRCAFTPALADMEMQGMKLDADRVMEEYKKEQDNEERLRYKLEEQMEPLSPGSKVDLAKYLYQELGFDELRDKRGDPIRTAKDNKPKTDQDTLAALKATTKEQRDFMALYSDWNSSKQRISKYLDFYYAVCKQQDGVFYARFNQTVAVTHRLTSSGERIVFDHVMQNNKNKEGSTQFQNQPREYKKFYTAKRPDFLMCEEDGSSLEFIVAGMVGNDKQIAEDIQNPDFDAHRRSASFKYKKDEADITKAERTGGKAITFKPLFGGESGTPAEKAYFKAFKERYHGLVRTQNGWLMEAQTDKRVILPWGLRIYFPRIKPGKDYIPEKAQIFNLPIQSFATADIIPVQALVLWHLIRNSDVKDKMVLVNTVHDSVISEVHTEYQPEYTEFVTQSWKQVFPFITAVYGEKVGQMMDRIPLGTEIQFGTHWGDGEEIGFTITRDEIKRK